MAYTPSSVTVHIGSPPKINYMTQPRPERVAPAQMAKDEMACAPTRSRVRARMVGDQVMFLPERRTAPPSLTLSSPLAAFYNWLFR